MSYVFKKLLEETNPYDNVTIIHKVDTVSLPELVAAFQDFVRGCGFAGTVVIEHSYEEPRGTANDIESFDEVDDDNA